MQMKQDIKTIKGFTGVDLSIAVVVLMLFVSLITTLFYNIYLTSASTKRSTQANAFIVDVLEQIEKMKYDEVTEDTAAEANDTFLQTIKEKVKDNRLEIVRGTVQESTTTSKPYTLGISVINYNQTAGNTDKEDLVKTITVSIKYKVGKKVEIKENKKVKSRETGIKDSLGIRPKLSAGMTPVKWILTDEATQEGYWQVTTQSDPEWFDYKHKRWANIMLQDGLEYETTGDTIGRVTKEGSMFVYLPRYAYKIPQSNFHTKNAASIEIKFLDQYNNCLDGSGQVIQTAITSNTAGTPVNSSTDYIQHPAFTLGGKELEGIWVGKFETSNPGCSQDVTSGQLAYASVTDKKVQSKPNVTSWRNIPVTDMFTMAQAMCSTNYSYYGFNGANFVDSHMLKNIEWGAAAYLAQSIYGKNAPVYINNNSSYITGIAGNTQDAAASADVTNRYHTLNGQQASTTGNIYGIYDMSGGAWEYTMGYLTTATANTYVTNFNSKVPDRYKDIYVGTGADTLAGSTENYIANNNHYGDAIWETSNVTDQYSSWYQDYSYMPTAGTPIMARGGNSVNTTLSGLFFFGKGNGAAEPRFTFRISITI